MGDRWENCGSWYFVNCFISKGTVATRYPDKFERFDGGSDGIFSGPERELKWLETDWNLVNGRCDGFSLRQLTRCASVNAPMQQHNWHHVTLAARKTDCACSLCTRALTDRTYADLVGKILEERVWKWPPKYYDFKSLRWKCRIFLNNLVRRPCSKVVDDLRKKYNILFLLLIQM